MKKKFKNHKTHYSRFILLVFSILFLTNSTHAQCSSSCLAEIKIDYECVKTTNSIPCYGTTNAYINNITPYNVATNTITIGNQNFPGGTVSKMTITEITITNSSGTGIGGTFNTAADFNSSAYHTATNITFADGANAVISASPGPPASRTGWTFFFTVNAVNSDGVIVNGSDGVTPASRSYSFKIVKDGYIVGDPHITTLDGVNYDFQSKGEFTALRGETNEDFEIQTRQSAVATGVPGPNPYTGLATCVSINTAVAARVGKQRVTYQPSLDGTADPKGMELRVDGVVTKLGENGLALSSGGRIVKSSAGDGIQIDFPDGASLVVTSNWWAHYSVWYLNVQIYRTGATRGIMGIIPTDDSIPSTGTSNSRRRSWLPALPDGSSLGPRPELHVRFVQLYRTFADAWRVTDATSLFDYAPTKSTADFTEKNWPVENPQTCNIPNQTPSPQPPIMLSVAEELCRDIVDPNMKANAIFDVMVTGDSSFAKAYLVTQQVQTGTTATFLNASKDTTKSKEAVTFTALVVRKFSTNTGTLAGAVEFTVDGEKIGLVKLEADGRAILTTSSLKVGQHQVAAKFIPDSGGTVFSSSSPSMTHIVTGGSAILHQWWFWLLVLLIIIGIIIAMRKKKSNP